MIKAFFQNKVAVISAIIIIIICLLAVFVPVFSSNDTARQDLSSRLSAPGPGHILGTDELGRDVFTRLFSGTRVSLAIAIIPTALAVILGTVLGICGAYFGKIPDMFITWLVDVILAFPGMLIAMVIMYTFGGSMSSVVLSIVIMECGSIARVVRSVTLSLLENEYITAAKTMGVGRTAIITRHILPNLAPTLIVLFTLNIPASILSESALSFLGIGIQPPGVSLGLMVSQSKSFLFQIPRLSLLPSGMVMLLVLAFNYLGDAMRDMLDPKTMYEAH
jgi:peptide/nickel transport system permease protein